METYIYFAVSGTVSRLLPLAMGLLRWRELGRAGILLVSFVLLSFVGDVAMLLVWKVFRKSNLWVSHVLIALQTPVLLLAFTEWARGSWLHRVLRISAVLAVVAWLLLTLLLESPSRFARFTGPLQAALFCFAAISVLVQRGLGSESRLSSTDWFWAAAAVLLVYGLTAVYRPLLDLFTTRGITAIPAWTVLKSLMVLQVIANVMFARSLFCSRETAVTPIPAPA